jgi:hypothetical protein
MESFIINTSTSSSKFRLCSYFFKIIKLAFKKYLTIIKKIKLNKKNMKKFVLSVSAGLESVAKKEIEKQGGNIIEVVDRLITFE